MHIHLFNPAQLCEVAKRGIVFVSRTQKTEVTTSSLTQVQINGTGPPRPGALVQPSSLLSREPVPTPGLCSKGLALPEKKRRGGQLNSGTSRCRGRRQVCSPSETRGTARRASPPSRRHGFPGSPQVLPRSSPA